MKKNQAVIRKTDGWLGSDTKFILVSFQDANELVQTIVGLNTRDTMKNQKQL